MFFFCVHGDLAMASQLMKFVCWKYLHRHFLEFNLGPVFNIDRDPPTDWPMVISKVKQMLKPFAESALVKTTCCAGWWQCKCRPRPLQG